LNVVLVKVLVELGWGLLRVLAVPVVTTTVHRVELVLLGSLLEIAHVVLGVVVVELVFIPIVVVFHKKVLGKVVRREVFCPTVSLGLILCGLLLLIDLAHNLFCLEMSVEVDQLLPHPCYHNNLLSKQFVQMCNIRLNVRARLINIIQ
jgi:hypothetical protein